MRPIDADALHKAYMELRNFKQDPQSGDWISLRAVPLTTVIRMLNEAPTIEPKQGEWILLKPRYPIEQKVYWNKEQALADTKGNGAIERRKCSCCGYNKSFMCHMKDEQIKLWNFCPNCGARMKGADDETEMF